MLDFTYRAFKSGAIEIYAFNNEKQVGRVKVIDLTEPAAYIPCLNIRKNHRRKGYGYAIMKQIESLCLKNDCGVMSLYVSCTNEPAIALYKSLGFFIALRTNKKERHYLMVKKNEKIT